MLRRTRFFIFGGIVATPVAALASVTAALVAVSCLSDENYVKFYDFVNTLRDI